MDQKQEASLLAILHNDVNAMFNQTAQIRKKIKKIELRLCNIEDYTRDACRMLSSLCNEPHIKRKDET